MRGIERERSTLLKLCFQGDTSPKIPGIYVTKEEAVSLTYNLSCARDILGGERVDGRCYGVGRGGQIGMQASPVGGMDGM